MFDNRQNVLKIQLYYMPSPPAAVAKPYLDNDFDMVDLDPNRS